MPHPLAKARLEMMRSSIRPNIDAVEMIEKMFEAKKADPYVQHEMIIIGVGFLSVAEEIDVLTYACTIFIDEFEHHNAILHDGRLLLMSDFWGEEN